MFRSIETERLRLRPFSVSDLNAALEYLSCADVLRYISVEPYTEETLLPILQELEQLQTKGKTPHKIAVELKEEKTLIGHLVFDQFSERYNTREIGYIFNPKYSGKGYATEASRALMNFAFKELELHRMIATCDPRNKASWGIMHKLGMRREAHFVKDIYLHGEWSDEYFYAILQEEWMKRA